MFEYYKVWIVDDDGNKVYSFIKNKNENWMKHAVDIGKNVIIVLQSRIYDIYNMDNNRWIRARIESLYPWFGYKNREYINRNIVKRDFPEKWYEHAYDVHEIQNGYIGFMIGEPNGNFIGSINSVNVFDFEDYFIYYDGTYGFW